MPFNAIHGKYLTGNFAEMLFQVVFDRAKRRWSKGKKMTEIT